MDIWLIDEIELSTKQIVGFRIQNDNLILSFIDGREITLIFNSRNEALKLYYRLNQRLSLGGLTTIFINDSVIKVKKDVYQIHVANNIPAFKFLKIFQKEGHQ